MTTPKNEKPEATNAPELPEVAVTEDDAEALLNFLGAPVERDVPGDEPEPAPVAPPADEAPEAPAPVEDEDDVPFWPFWVKTEDGETVRADQHGQPLP